ncbi:glutamate receptor 2-like isoform X2 [Oscarella lobularis]|uniref:glutamate receptor 2-like isoform X2 n=1 Tax=Oscarella lobularis TaxID=121494 RepID=UPI003314062E
MASGVSTRNLRRRSFDVALWLFLSATLAFGVELPSYVVHADGYDSKTVDFLNATAAWLLSSSIARLEVTNASVKRDFANDAVISLHMRRTAPTGQPFQFRFPVVTGPGPPRIGFGASVRGLVDVASAIIESRAISRFWCISDAIPAFDCHGYLRPDDNFQSDLQQLEDENAVLLVHCVTIDCYQHFKSVLRFIGSTSRAKIDVIVTEDVTNKVHHDVNFWDGYAKRVSIIGMRRDFPRNSVYRQLSSLLEKATNCTQLAHCSHETNAEILADVIYLHDAVLVLNTLAPGNMSTLPNRLRHSDAVGAAGPIVFDSDLRGRIHPSYEILELSSSKQERIGWYTEGRLLWTTEPKAEPPSPHHHRNRRAVGNRCDEAAKTQSKSYYNITTIVETPFLYSDPEKKFFPGRTHKNGLTGLIVDFAEELSTRLHFEYDLHLVPDETYGRIKIDADRSVTAGGMIGQMLRCEMDLALAPLTITATREKYISFTKPWMDIGLGLLATKPEPAHTRLFAFMDPFSNLTWLAIVLSWFGVSVAVAVLQHILALGDPEAKKRKIFPDCKWGGTSFRIRIYKALWYLYATAMQQGPEGVRQLPAKIAVGGWFFFTLITISTYTANLAAFLTVSKIPSTIETVDQLSQQTDVPYGTVKETGVEAFFVNSSVETYKTMGRFMSLNGENMVDSAIEGFNRVSNGTYVFIWDSPILQFFESQIPCKSRIVGRTFNKQGYGIAMPQHAAYLRNFTLEVLKMRGEGWMEDASRRWLDAGECVDESSSTTDADQVGIQHMIGVFIVLAFALGLAFVLALVIRLAIYKSESRKRPKSVRMSASNAAAVATLASVIPTELPERQDSEKKVENGYVSYLGNLSDFTTSWV